LTAPWAARGGCMRRPLADRRTPSPIAQPSTSRRRPHTGGGIAGERHWRLRGRTARSCGRLPLPVVLAVVALAVIGCGDDEGSVTAETATTGIGATDAATTETAATGLPKLIGTVGSTDDPDAHEISLRTEDGSEVTTTLPPRRYTLEINDLSTIHNFHLGGPMPRSTWPPMSLALARRRPSSCSRSRRRTSMSATRTRPR
jgi:hypothetical protein